MPTAVCIPGENWVLFFVYNREGGRQNACMRTGLVSLCVSWAVQPVFTRLLDTLARYHAFVTFRRILDKLE